MRQDINLRNRLKLRHIELLAALDAEGTLHGAARRLGMTQPAATRLLREIEELMQDQLFLRSRKGMVATDAGEILIRHARLILGGIDHAINEMRTFKAGASGNLRIGQFANAPPTLLARAILTLKSSSPGLKVQILEGTQTAISALVHDGELQLAITRAPSQDTEDAFDFRVLLHERFSVICSMLHRCRDELHPDTGLAALIDEPWVLPLPSTPLRANLDLQFWAQCGRLPANIVEYSTHAGTALVTLLQEGNYVALVPSRIARELERLQLARILLRELPHLVGPIGILTRRGEALPSQASRLVEALCLQALAM